jgi:hypothetical protein
VRAIVWSAQMASLLLVRLPLLSPLPDHINLRMLTVGNRRIVYDLVVQTVQQARVGRLTIAPDRVVSSAPCFSRHLGPGPRM